MKVIADFCVVPLGVGTSLSPYVAACQKVLERHQVIHSMHAYGTNIEGDWDEVMAAVRSCHDELHRMGAPRISTTMRLGTRVDRDQSMDDKLRSVREKL